MGLSIEQKALVEKNMNLVPYILKKYINLTEDIDMRYEELIQQGNFALCKAAKKYNNSVKFNTYAEVVVRNELYKYCKKVSRKPRTISIDEVGDRGSIGKDEKQIDDSLIAKDNLRTLRKIKRNYKGVVRKGINAIELKMQGVAGVDIAKMYRVKPNHVSAWISKAKKELCSNAKYLL